MLTIMEIAVHDWKTLSIDELIKKYNFSLESLYEIALKQGLHKYSTQNERRRMTDVEKSFIGNNQNLSVTQVSNILHKSYNGTLMQIKTLGHYNMIGK
ncbi:hypothetical protein D922_02996 [Enterococcus faecalis 06-MB-DW-09]|nr:hypothetical protein D922_02996 [Enterococcus faecalis 06-MB-DW-09]